MGRRALLIVGFLAAMGGATASGEIQECGQGPHISVATLQRAGVALSAQQLCTVAPDPNEVWVDGVAGDDANTGARTSPVRTIGRCISMLADVQQADPGAAVACRLRGGVYHEQLHVQGLHYLTISAWDNEEVVLDGTVELTGGWSELPNGIWRSNQPQTIWQLFVDRQPMTLARFPNAPVGSPLVWEHASGAGWRVASSATTMYHTVDDDTNNQSTTLAEAGRSFNGCPVVLNSGHWQTVSSTVANHTAGTNAFDHPDDTDFDFACCDGHGRYFIEGCEAALDSDGEWSYTDDKSGHILFRPPEGVDMNTASMRGKMQSYGMVIDSCSNVEIGGVTFHATSLLTWNTVDSRIVDCNFQYSSYSRRALREDVMPTLADPHIVPQLADDASFDGYGVKFARLDTCPVYFGTNWQENTNLTIFNNSFYGGDGPTIFFRATSHDLIENNLFQDVGYSGITGNCGPAGCSGGTTGFPVYGVMYPGPYSVVRRNTMVTAGPSEGILIGKEHITVEYNYFDNLGLVQTDGYAVHAYKTGQNGAIIHHNWAVNTALGGYRFDAAEDGLFGRNGTMLRNVAIATKTAGLAVKGFEHVVRHNTAIGSSVNEYVIFGCYPTATGSDPSQRCAEDRFQNNDDVIVENNAGGSLSTRIDVYTPITFGQSVTHNLNQASTTSPSQYDYLRDPDHGDLRPRVGFGDALIDKGIAVAGDTAYHGAAPDIGAYESGGDSSQYWMPGRQASVASIPVPFDQAVGVMPDSDLIFLPAAGATHHTVTLWIDNASPLIMRLEAPANVAILTDLLPIGAVCQWRVSAAHPGGWVADGPLWSFTVLSSVQLAVSPIADSYVHRYATDCPCGGDAASTSCSTGCSGTSSDITRLQVRRTPSGVEHRISYLRFQLAGDARLALLAQSGAMAVSHVTLDLYVLSHDLSNANIYIATDAGVEWDESTLTWDNDAITYDAAAPVGTFSGVASDEWIRIDLQIPGLTNDWLTEQRNITLVATTTDTSPGYGLGFSSKEGSNPPQLLLAVESAT